MKILYCIAGTYNSGGMERVLANKANYLVRHGYEVVITTTDQRGKEPFFELDERIRCIDLGINYEENNGKSLFNKLLKYPFKQIRHRRRLARLLMQERPDITISMYCNEASLLPHIKDGSKKILEIHFSKFKRMQYGRKGLWRAVDWWRSRMDERLVARYDKFVVLTKEDKGYWGDLPNIVVIPNAIQTFPHIKADLSTNKVVAIGRYTQQKGFDMLLDAWALVVEEYPYWTLDIVGHGEDQGLLESQIKHLKLISSVQLVPTTNCIDKIYRHASCYVMSSRYEGLPMVLLEAQSYGLPIVSFTCKCGPKDIITDGIDGLLVDEGDIRGLASALCRVIQDSSLRKKMGEKAIIASQQYRESIIMPQWEKLFESCVKNENNRYICG